MLDAQEKKRFARLIFLDIIVSILDIAFLALLLYVIRYYTTDQAMRRPFPFFTTAGRFPLLPITIFFILFSLKNLFGFLVFRGQYRFFYHVASRLSGSNLAHYLDGSYSNYVNTDSSVHIRKISQQPVEFIHYVLGGFHLIISQSILVLITIAAILIYNPVLFPLLFLILAPPVTIVGLFMKKRQTEIRKTAKKTSVLVLQNLQEALSGFVETNLYGRKQFFKNRYHSQQEIFNQFLSGQYVIQNMPSRLIEVFAIFGLLILILIHFFTAKENLIDVVTIGAFVAAAYKIIPGIVKILNSLGHIRAYQFTVTDLLENARKNIRQQTATPETITAVAFDNVSFDYAEKNILSGFSCSFQKGDIVGISGISGSGKTTFINLLLGFLTPSSGEIIFNGRSTTMIERQQYWPQIAYVKQQPFLIHDALSKNISLTDNEDKEKIKEVIHLAGLDSLVNEHREKENFVLTEAGKNLSGGQRQRVGFARALYKNAEIMVLDEPFSELDSDSEKNLLQYLKLLSLQGKIIVLVTHNSESLSFCNKIIGFNAG